MSTQESKQLSFAVSADDSALITKCVERWEQDHKRYEIPFNRRRVHMDLTVCHANACPLDLKAMLAGNPADFSHDFAGIERYLDRKQGALTNCFVPRFAKRN